MPRYAQNYFEMSRRMSRNPHTLATGTALPNYCSLARIPASIRLASRRDRVYTAALREIALCEGRGPRGHRLRGDSVVRTYH